MKALKITQAIVLPLLLLVGLAALVLYSSGLFTEPQLRLEPGRLNAGALALLSLALRSAAFAVLAAVYLCFNLWKESLPHLLIPVGAGLALLALCGLFLTLGLRPLRSHYTERLADFQTEFDPGEFRTGTRQIYPPVLTGTVTAYRRYSHGDTLSETVTVMYDSKAYQAELTRIGLLELPSFRWGEWVCSNLELDGSTFQIRHSARTRQIVYGRYCPPEDLPDFAPQPVYPSGS